MVKKKGCDKATLNETEHLTEFGLTTKLYAIFVVLFFAFYHHRRRHCYCHRNLHCQTFPLSY